MNINKKFLFGLFLLVLENLAISSEQARAAGKTIRDFICSYEGCGKAFARKVDFARHDLTHTDERPHVCHLCGKGFIRKDRLNAHMYTHTNEKPYVCDTCGKAFARKNALDSHMCIHTGKWPYVCGVCDKGFVKSINLAQHKRTHTGEKPYVCGVCGMKFAQMSHLTRHKRTHDSEKPFIHDQKASVDKKRLRDTDIVEFEDPGLLDDFFISVSAGGLVSADLGLDNASAQSLFDDFLEDV